jgi:hypothetical protein
MPPKECANVLRQSIDVGLVVEEMAGDTRSVNARRVAGPGSGWAGRSHLAEVADPRYRALRGKPDAGGSEEDLPLQRRKFPANVVKVHEPNSPGVGPLYRIKVSFQDLGSDELSGVLGSANDLTGKNYEQSYW